jgi:spore germination cell wall hydrolase CwlJ-like protein
MGTNIFQNRLSFSVFVWLAITINIGLNYQSITKSFTYLEAAIVRSVDRASNIVDALTQSTVTMTDNLVKVEAKQKAVPTNDLQCMAENIYYEAGNQSYAGKIAVGQVVLNRVKDPRYPRTVCGVIYDGSQNVKTTACQFSWTCADHKGVDKTSAFWHESQKAARELLTKKDMVIDITEGATSYHANYVKPAWSKTLTFVAQIDQHLFYKNER